MTSLISWNDPALAQSQALEMLYSRFMRPSTSTIAGSQASSLPISSPSSLADDTPPLTWKDIAATSHPARWQLEVIIADHGSKPWKTVSKLHPDLVQAVMDELQRILDSSPQMESGPRTAAIKCLQAIGTFFDVLPASMMIQDVILDSDKPSCGGGFADVYFGRVGSHRVALKVLRTFGNNGAEENTKTLKAFCREALLWRQLQHPRILPLFGVNAVTFHPRRCLVSPYLVNGNVNQFLEKNPTHDRLQMIIEIMDGIQFLHGHARPLVHADIRGANILVKGDLTCCISDFGLTMVVDPRITSSRLTGGATRWLAPEVLDQAQVTPVEDMPSRDIYAFGCTAIEVCSGDVPFSDIHLETHVLLKVLNEKQKPPLPTYFLPQGAWDIVDRCLAYEAKHRPRAREVLEILMVIWKEEAWYAFRTMLKDTEKLLEGTPFSTTIAILTAVIDTLHDVLDNLKQESIIVRLIPFTHHLKNLLGLMKDKKYLHGINPAREHINSILRDANAALERTQRSINTVEANEYQRQVEDIIRRVNEAVNTFETELPSVTSQHRSSALQQERAITEDDTKSPSAPKHALIIGIDTYEHQGKIIPQLSGCVADAKDIYAFLTKTVHFPPENITCLHNEEATASKIVAALEHLAKDPNIPKGSTTFIFFAGHGTEVEGPKGSHCRKIQMIVPYDFDPGSSTSKLLPRGDAEIVDKVMVGDSIYHGGIAKNGLPDFKLNQLLEDIADKKGENITVIFDCCHSGSGTRGSRRADEDYTVARGIDLPHSTTIDIDTLPRSRALMVLDEDRNKGLASHVFLAACNENQLAYERRGRGAFTYALLSLLRSANLQQLTYLNIINSFPPGKLSEQDPQCEGANKDHIFLHVNLVAERQNIVGTEFTVYDTISLTSELGRLVVERTNALESFARDKGRAIDMPAAGAFAIQTRRGATVDDVRLLVNPADLVAVFKDIKRQEFDMSASTPSFKLVTSRRRKPDLVVTANKRNLSVEVTDQICHDAGLCSIIFPRPADNETMTKVLRGVAHFYWNLHHTNPSNRDQIAGVTLGCFELEYRNSARHLYGMYRKSGNLVSENKIHIPISASAHDEKSYGFRLKNKTNLPFFVSMFYFNMSDLSISSYYQPPSARPDGHRPSLPAVGQLAIGYGESGWPAKSYYLNDGQKVDVGYIKVFLSTEYVDYSDLPQVSPFSDGEGRGSHDAHTKYHLWGTITIPVIQRRR